MAATIDVPDPTNVMGRRIAAYLIDAVLGTVLLLAVIIPLLLGAFQERSFADDTAASADCDQVNSATFDTENAPNESSSDGSDNDEFTFCVPLGDSSYTMEGSDLGRLLLWSYVVSYAVQALNTVLLQSIAGGSLGKLCTGVRVVREDGTHAGIGWNLLRTLLFVADGQCFIGLILALTTRGHRRLGDMVASTYVVGRAAVGQPVTLPPQRSNYAAGPIAPPPSPDGPFWDGERNAYIQYDRPHGAWFQWNDASQSWHPIDQ